MWKGLSLVVITACTGCAYSNAVDKMVNNDFVSVVPQPAPQSLVGDWTGNIGPYLSTLRVNADGTGLHCYSWGTANTVERMKHRDGKLFFQSSGELEVAELGADSFVLRWNQPGVKDAKVVRDRTLQQASPYCSKELRASQ